MSLPLTLPTERSAAVSGRILQLDGLRAIAILLVIVAHTLHTPLAWVGVDIFFVLSGFLITGILLARKRGGGGYFSYFYRRRIFRILPPYILTVLVFGLLFGWATFRPWPMYAFFGMNFDPIWGHGNPLPLWSLAVEEQFYLFWPFVILFFSEKWLLRVALAVVVLTPLLRVLCTPAFPSFVDIYMLTPFRADLLCAGAVMTLLWKDRSPRLEEFFRKRAWIGVLGGFGGLVFVQIWPLFRLASNTRRANGLDYSLSLIGAFSLIAWVLADRGWLRRWLTSRPMRFIGEISYTMYLFHLIVEMLVLPHVHSRVLVLVLTLSGTMVWASLSWFLMERPLIRFAARSAPAHAHAAAA